MINEEKNIDIDFDFLIEDKRVYYDKWKFHDFLEKTFQKNSDFSNIFSKNKNERFLEYEENHNFFYNKNWISEKK
jgi:hypothetical protein